MTIMYKLMTLSKVIPSINMVFNYNECCKDVHTSLKETGYCSFVVGMELITNDL
jgi:hypothetical protein